MTYKSHLTYSTLFLSLFFYSFAFQSHSKAVINKRLIFGKWTYLNSFAGKVIMVFNKDGTGYRFTDSSKIEQKFKYQITNHSLLKFYIKTYKPETYQIDSLTTQILTLREYPIIKIKESISVYETTFRRN